MVWLFSLLASLTTVQAALFGVYSSPTCEQASLVVPVLAFSDVCTWSTSSVSYALYLEDCSADSLSVRYYNASDSATCADFPVNQTFPVTADCTLANDAFYTQLWNSSECQGYGTTLNIVAHDHADCSDLGLPFSVVTANYTCIGNSFAPQYIPGSWDTKTLAQESFFYMEVYQTTNGTCEYPLGTFLATNNYAGQCLVPASGFSNTTFVQVYEAFPV